MCQLSRSSCVVACAVLAALVSNLNLLGDPQPSTPLFRPGRILVQPKPGNNLKSLHIQSGARIQSLLSEAGLQVIELPSGSTVAEAVAAYQQSGEVEFAEPDYILRASIAPDDPSYINGALWALHNTGQQGGLAGADLGAEQAWDLLSSASNIVVAVVDSGIRYTHEDLAANIWTNPAEIADNGLDDDRDGIIDDVHGFNAYANSGDPWDDNGHGTHVAGIIGAAGDNAKGSVGVAWKVQLMACKFMDANGEGNSSDAIAAIDYARKHGAQIINASWGGSPFSYALQSAIKRAQSAGIIFVVAAGNESQNLDQQPSYPASYSLANVVTVAATTREDLLADYSNVGAKRVMLAAPGSEIYSTWNTSDHAYAVESGTSMATPYVTGVLALTKALFPQDSYQQLIQRVVAATDPLAVLKGKCSSGGRLNLRKALGAPAKASAIRLTVVANPSADSGRFNLTGDAGATYVIEFSDDLATWTQLLTKQADTKGTLSFDDPGDVSSDQRYYRARLVPLQ